MHDFTETDEFVRPGPFQQRQWEITFQQLITNLNQVLAQSPGSNFLDIDPLPIISLMESYTSKTSDWLEYAHGDENQCFTRNLVDRGNGKSNLLILVWSPGSQSPIHDHAGSHCVMKMLQGSLKEVQYDWPDKEVLERGKPSPLRPRKESLVTTNQVTYIEDSHGLHKISNPDPLEFAVSLHLYAPPNAAKYGCQVFDEKSGQATHVVQYQLYSEMGVINDHKA